MKLKRAHIQNFKLLRDVELEFSLDPDRPITVIRAENGSGKTSALTALQWGLFGEAGLDPAAREVRLSPSDWPDGQRCEVRVRIDFAHTTFDNVGGEVVARRTDYSVMRTVNEVPRGEKEFTRERDQLHLFELTDKGNEDQPGADLLLGEMLPPEMKDVFFTDGDRAMNFVSPSLARTTKQHQVKTAIRSLLGVASLEGVLLHLRHASGKFNQQLAKAAGAEETTVHTELEEKRAVVKRCQERIDDLDDQIERIAKQEQEADRKLLDAMKGIEDHAELARRLEAARQQLKEATDGEQRLKKRHQGLLAAESLSWALLRHKLTAGLTVLSQLANKGVIPATALPVLQDRLTLGRCICDADLSEGTPARAAVTHLLEAQRKVDEGKKVLTELLHRGQAAVDAQRAGDDGAGKWTVEYDELAKDRVQAIKLIENTKRAIAEIEQKISAIDQGVIDELKKGRDAYRKNKTTKEGDKRDAEIEQRTAQVRVAELEALWKEIAAANKKQRTINSRIQVAQDLTAVVNNTLSELQSVYMRRVSERMNALFLQMVGADATAAGGVFKKAEITPEYDIKVLSADSRSLDPDSELNGASKRALTLAFIWALTEVSGVIAPRVIDTPLGMMSGGVKRRVVEILSDPDGVTPQGANDRPRDRREFQVVLFLTRQEILMVEDLLDARAGAVSTLTNSASYPVDLVNDPQLGQPTILTCECTHRQSCRVCARKDDDRHQLSVRTVPH